MSFHSNYEMKIKTVCLYSISSSSFNPSRLSWHPPPQKSTCIRCGRSHRTTWSPGSRISWRASAPSSTGPTLIPTSLSWGPSLWPPKTPSTSSGPPRGLWRPTRPKLRASPPELSSTSVSSSSSIQPLRWKFDSGLFVNLFILKQWHGKFVFFFLRWWKLVQAAVGILVTIAQLVSSSIYLYTQVCALLFMEIFVYLFCLDWEEVRERTGKDLVIKCFCSWWWVLALDWQA